MLTKQYKSYHNYEKAPVTSVAGEITTGFAAIAKKILAACEKEKTIVVLEAYPGVDRADLFALADALSPVCLIDADSCAFSKEKLADTWKEELTDDRVFGKMTTAKLSDYYESDAIEAARAQLDAVDTGVCVVAGTGASLIHPGDVTAYCDLSRWEIQLRWRAGGTN